MFNHIYNTDIHAAQYNYPLCYIFQYVTLATPWLSLAKSHPRECYEWEHWPLDLSTKGPLSMHCLQDTTRIRNWIISLDYGVRFHMSHVASDIWWVREIGTCFVLERCDFGIYHYHAITHVPTKITSSECDAVKGYWWWIVRQFRMHISIADSLLTSVLIKKTKWNWFLATNRIDSRPTFWQYDIASIHAHWYNIVMWYAIGKL